MDADDVAMLAMAMLRGSGRLNDKNVDCFIEGYKACMQALYVPKLLIPVLQYHLNEYPKTRENIDLAIGYADLRRGYTEEEAAREYANENMWYPGETSYESDIIAMEDSFADAFKAGASHVLSLPLSQRLRDEERERVRKLYIDANDKLKICLNAMNYNQISELDNEYKKGINMGLILALKFIFGKEFFGEGEG